ncbi:MAG: tetratricopeptide repeat protein, partial [Myxococcales bacterium]|nr:tetratricopeptide repeat protein [Myxococcales bacterium]
MRRFYHLFLVACVACESGSVVYDSPVDAGLERRLAQARVNAVQSGSTDALVTLGQTALEAKKYFEAAENFLKAREQGPESTLIYAGLARTYVELGYTVSSVDAIRQCFRLNRTEPDCLYAFGTLITSDPSDKAQREAQRTWERFLRVAPANHPQRGYVESTLAQLNSKYGRLTTEQIVGTKTSGKAPSPPSNQPSSSAANSQRQTSTSSAWAQKSTKAVDPHQTAGDPHGTAKDPHAVTGDPHAVIGDPHVVAKDNSTNGDDSPPVGELNQFGAALQKAYQAWANKDPVGAESAFRKALDIRPNDAPAMAELARVLTETNKIVEAEDWVNKAWAAAPNDPQVRFAFGFVLLQARKRPKEAIEAWRDLQKDHPDFARKSGVTEMLKTIDNATSPAAGTAPASAPSIPSLHSSPPSQSGEIPPTNSIRKETGTVSPPATSAKTSMVESKPTPPEAESKPSTPQAESKPSAPKAESKPSTPQAESKPSTPKAESKPSTPKAESKPS